MEERKQILIRLDKENRIYTEYYIPNNDNKLEVVNHSYITEKAVEDIISFYKEHAMKDFIYKCTLIINPYLYAQEIYEIGFKMGSIISEEENKLEIVTEVLLEN